MEAMMEDYHSSHTGILWQWNRWINAKPNDPHGFKEELKIKYDAVLAVVGKFPNGTGPMLELLKVEAAPMDWDDYCLMDVADQEI